MPGQLAQKIRAKYPGVYDDIDDATLEAQVLAKYPEYRDLVEQEPQDEPSLLDRVADTGPPSAARAGAMFLRFIRDNPSTAGAMAGGALAAPFTGGMSIPGAMLTVGGASAAGSGAGQVLSGQDVSLKEMAAEGAAGAVGQGAGALVAKAAGAVAPKLLKGILRPTKRMQDEYGDVVGIALRERIPVGQSAVADARATASREAVDDLLRAEDAKRPVVRGLLPPAREHIPLGNPQPTMPKGAGVLLGKEIVSPGPGAPAGMVDPRELLTGLQGARRDLAARALPDEGLGELSELEQRFLQQRNRPLTLTETNQIKRAEQKLANTAFRAEEAGNPINPVQAKFHKGMSVGAQRAVESRVPKIRGMNTRTQELMGLQEALEAAEARSGGIVGMNPANWLSGLAPGLGSRGAFLIDSLSRAPLPGAGRLNLQALVGLLTQEDGAR